MISRERITRHLYFWLWKSADFEENFRIEWKAVFDRFDEGKPDLVPENVLRMVYQWATENLPF